MGKKGEKIVGGGLSMSTAMGKLHAEEGTRACPPRQKKSINRKKVTGRDLTAKLYYRFGGG